MADEKPIKTGSFIVKRQNASIFAKKKYHCLKLFTDHLDIIVPDSVSRMEPKYIITPDQNTLIKKDFNYDIKLENQDLQLIIGIKDKKLQEEWFKDLTDVLVRCERKEKSPPKKLDNKTCKNTFHIHSVANVVKRPVEHSILKIEHGLLSISSSSNEVLQSWPMKTIRKFKFDSRYSMLSFQVKKPNEYCYFSISKSDALELKTLLTSETGGGDINETNMDHRQKLINSHFNSKSHLSKENLSEQKLNLLPSNSNENNLSVAKSTKLPTPDTKSQISIEEDEVCEDYDGPADDYGYSGDADNLSTDIPKQVLVSNFCASNALGSLKNMLRQKFSFPNQNKISNEPNLKPNSTFHIYDGPNENYHHSDEQMSLPKEKKNLLPSKSIGNSNTDTQRVTRPLSAEEEDICEDYDGPTDDYGYIREPDKLAEPKPILTDDEKRAKVIVNSPSLKKLLQQKLAANSQFSQEGNFGSSSEIYDGPREDYFSDMHSKNLSDEDQNKLSYSTDNVREEVLSQLRLTLIKKRPNMALDKEPNECQLVSDLKRNDEFKDTKTEDEPSNNIITDISRYAVDGGEEYAIARKSLIY